jgi:DNA-binding SARP family transcriptional activator/tetratricopeptide (TPR) repeat protein
VSGQAGRDAQATVEIAVLGGFEVRDGGRVVPRDAWGRRHASGLVKLLALSPGRRLHREQVIDALWPDDTVDEAAPKLHKAAHYARRAMDDRNAIVLRGETVALFPDRPVTVDAVAFESAAVAALRAGDAAALQAALDASRGELLPDDPYEDWAEPVRQRLRHLRADVLRRLGRWAELVQLDPTDEEAHLAIMRELALAGDRHGALRQYERLDRALARELGVGPGPEVTRLRDEVLAGADRGPTPAADPATPPRARPVELVGRAAERAVVDGFLGDAASGRGGTLVLSGPAGVGKSALLAWTRRRADERGWRTGQGVAAAVEGAWSYAPVLEAVADLCRRHPTLLDGLDDNYRTEIDRALAGTDLDWSGEGGHQRLFVAVAELLRLAALDRGALLVVDEVHEADEASLRLLHYLGRCAATERIALVLAHRPAPLPPGFEQVRNSLLARGAAVAHELAPLPPADAAALVEQVRPGTPADTAGRIVELARGLPFAVVELARHADAPAWEQSADLVPLRGLAPRTREILQRVAVLGTTFATDEFVALSELPDEQAFRHLDEAIEAGVVEHTGAHYQFHHGLVRDALIRDVAPHRQSRIHRDAAARLAALGASPARIGHHLLAAGEPTAAGPYLLRAAEREAAIGAYRDALDLVASILAHVDGRDRSRALALRADLLFALGDPTAPSAYRHALQAAAPGEQPLLRARLARAAVIAGDIDTAVAALDRIEPDGGPGDGDILLARGQVAYFTGDFDAAWQISEQARARVLGGDQSWQVLDLVALQGLLAHVRGEWFDRLGRELQRTRESPELALAIFDGYLCPAEYLLYGPTPYGEVIELARSLRDTARRAGALRAVAFASALLGEAAFLAGDLELAERELAEAVDLHRDIAAPSGEAHSLQRLAEVALARGDRAEALRLLQRALPLARWSAISMHLLQRIFGTMIQAAPGPEAARAVVDRAESTLGTEDLCVFCNIMLAVPAAQACAAVGDLEHARHHLAVAERSVRLWDGTSWHAAVLETRAHLAAAGGDGDGAARLRTEAAALFDQAGQPLDAARCRTAPAA